MSFYTKPSQRVAIPPRLTKGILLKKRKGVFRRVIKSVLLLMKKEKIQTQNLATHFMNQYHSLHGLPQIIRPDRDEHVQNLEQTRPETQNDWVISMKGKLEEAHRDDEMSSRGKLICIYKVPHYLHENDNKSYFPQTVSIGPYHHGEEQTRSMESHKWRAVNKVLMRSKQGIEMLFVAMKDLEAEARACYEGPIRLSSNEFVEMLVLDGCFVLELLRGVTEGFLALGYHHTDPIFAIRGSMHSIQRDMIMLENQIPLFVLNRLLELQARTENITVSVAQLTVRFFDPLKPTDETVAKKSGETAISIDPSTADLGELHCLDVFRRSLLLPKKEPRSSGKKWNWCSRVADKRQQHLIPSVTELRDAGFQFRKKDTDQFWDIGLKDGYLEIPGLLIHDGTKSLFLNLIAFEQCHIDSSNHITSYIIFMDNLINSPEDIKYLHECGIIEQSLGSNSEVANMFNRLCQEVVFNTDDIYLSQLSKDVYKIYNQNYFRRWNAWKTTLKQKYFDNPWAYFSFFAAVILLILTLSQTYFAAYDYFMPPS